MSAAAPIAADTATVRDRLRGLDRQERVVWLQRVGVADADILEALLDPSDPDLQAFVLAVLENGHGS